jgi:alkylation response protein AidB-like acyl-CoA dehydrogenase
MADCGLAYIPADYGDGIRKPEGGTNFGAVILIPFDVPGISKGKPLDKLGQRTVPQGEIFFDNVRLPRKYLIEDHAGYDASFFSVLTFENMSIALALSGLARASYDHAIAYAHERKQGGVPIIQHQSVQLRIFDMWSKVEMCRALSRRVVNFNFLSGEPHCLASVTSKVNVTQMAYQVADEALQMFGGNGLAKEYPMEKLYRDARASLIEDGENNILSLKGGNWLSEHYQETHI